MSNLEGEASAVIKELVAADSASEVTGAQKQVLCWLAGLQILRSRFSLGYVVRQLELEEKDGDRFGLSAEEFQTSLLGAALPSFLEAWSSRDDPSVRPKDRWNPYEWSLMQFRWDIVRFRSPSLVISDAFAAQSGIRTESRADFSPTQRRWAMHGFVVSMEECERVTMALSPYVGIHLHRSATRKLIKAEDFNRHTVYSSRDFVAHSPDWQDSNPRLYKLMMERLALQRMLRMAMPANF